MTFFRSLLFVCPAACLLAQTPPPSSAPASGGQSTPFTRPATSVARPPAAAKPPVVPPDRIVLKVGDQSLSAEQFDELIEMLPDQSKAQVRTAAGRKQFAENLVRVMVLAQEGKRRGLDQAPAFKVQSSFQEENYLAGLTFSQISKEGKVSDEDARKYYDEHKADWDVVKARHILIRFKGSPVPLKPGATELSDAEALAKAQELRKRLVAGQDFATIAKAESDDTGSGAQGGDLGTFGHGQMVAAFETAVYSLKPGEISEPVKTQFGYHIIQVESHQTRTFEEARADVERRMRPAESQKALEDLVKKGTPVFDADFFGTAKQ
jgi:peptidyl-prolyl cis-trans isomerase C